MEIRLFELEGLIRELFTMNIVTGLAALLKLTGSC